MVGFNSGQWLVDLVVEVVIGGVIFLLQSVQSVGFFFFFCIYFILQFGLI